LPDGKSGFLLFGLGGKMGSPDGRRIAYVAAPDAEVAYKKSMAGANIRILRGDGTVETKVVTRDMKVAPGGGEAAHAFLHQRKIWLLDASGTTRPAPPQTAPGLEFPHASAANSP
jgi:hypothetical protein